MSTARLFHKLTDEHGRTYGGTQWGPGVTHSGTGEGDLCGPGWVHVYDDPILAIFLNPIHANFQNPRMWEGTASGKILGDHGLKFGVETFTAIREIPCHKVTPEQQVRFGILCALEIYTEPGFVAWADGWLSSADRSAEVARAAWSTARAAWSTAVATRAAMVATRAAMAAAEAARTAGATEAAEMVAREVNLDLKALAKKAMETT